MFPLIWIRIAIVGVIVVFVAGVVWKFRHDSIELGRAEVRAEWTADIAKRTAQALAVSEAARVKETALQAAKQKVEESYAAEKKRRAAADVLAADSLRRLNAAITSRSPSPINPASAAGTDAAGTGDILRQCGEAVRDVAANADRIAIKLNALQGYVLAACK